MSLSQAEQHVAAHQLLIEMGELEAAEVMVDTATDDELLLMLEIELMDDLGLDVEIL